MMKHRSWIDGLRRYLFVIVLLNLIWEFLHMPLYQLWETGTRSEVVFAAVHCTGGDLLIALSALIVALLITGRHDWPRTNSKSLVTLTLLFGFLYTAYSEWLNIEVRGAWAYSDLMPVIPIINMGLSPALQWIVIPLAAFWWTRYRSPIFS